MGHDQLDQCRNEAAPKDRLILVSSGWAWQREDSHIPAKLIKRTGATIPERHYKERKLLGTVVMIYWMEESTRIDGGVWIVSGTGATFSQPFRFWADVNNPLSMDNTADHDPTLLVQNIVPNVDDMPVYTPSERVLEVRKLENMLRGG